MTDQDYAIDLRQATHEFEMGLVGVLAGFGLDNVRTQLVLDATPTVWQQSVYFIVDGQHLVDDVARGAAFTSQYWRRLRSHVDWEPLEPDHGAYSEPTIILMHHLAMQPPWLTVTTAPSSGAAPTASCAAAAVINPGCTSSSAPGRGWGWLAGLASNFTWVRVPRKV